MCVYLYFIAYSNHLFFLFFFHFLFFRLILMLIIFCLNKNKNILYKLI